MVRLPKQVDRVDPHKPQLAEIGFFQQPHDIVDIVLSCHHSRCISLTVVISAYIIQLFGVARNNFRLLFSVRKSTEKWGFLHRKKNKTPAGRTGGRM
nr:MAG TPA: hypothetical protein [Caudoviricetes sp.]